MHLTFFFGGRRTDDYTTLQIVAYSWIILIVKQRMRFCCCLSTTFNLIIFSFNISSTVKTDSSSFEMPILSFSMVIIKVHFQVKLIYMYRTLSNRLRCMKRKRKMVIIYLCFLKSFLSHYSHLLLICKF